MGMQMSRKKLLIVVDYQNDFVTGSLGFPGAVALEGPISEKIRAYRANGDEVAFTLDTHGDAYMETLEGKSLPVQHCLKGSEGWQLYGAVKGLRRDGDQAFVKNTFGSSALFRYLAGREEAYESVELVGVVTNICVMANAAIVRTALPETPVLVDAACVAGDDPSLHEKALDVMESLQIRVINRK